MKTFAFVFPPRREHFVPESIRSKIEHERYLELLGDEEARPAEFRLFREDYYTRSIRDNTHTSIHVYDIGSSEVGSLFASARVTGSVGGLLGMHTPRDAR